MSDIYVYNDQLWKAERIFEYTGEPEEFTINPGKYLFICKGASGGILTREPDKKKQLGGTSYGIIRITKTTKMYAVVGGNGSDAANNDLSIGGYNGGGNGGLGYSSNTYAGGAGGGATDIRLNILPDETIPIEDTEDQKVIKHSLLSRIIVAGGGGGLSTQSGGDYRKYCGVGGGIHGGPFTSTNEEVLATQENGYMFGIGMDGITKTTNSNYGPNGAGGGGGGWYGGFSQSTSGEYTDTCGGGGSGYVVTNESYKPDGYNDEVPESIRFTNPTMVGGSADKPEIIICRSTTYYSVGDKIIIPRTGRTEKFNLFIGKYVLKCWGGDGGVRNIIESSPRGGYAQGTLTLENVVMAYAHVGGPGIKYATTYENALLVDPSVGYNGGGVAGNINHRYSTFGGGATDIRIDSDSLLSRIIVAGGAGGHGAAETSGSRFGGAGGGSVGNPSSGSSYGTCPGPGTQTGTPEHLNVGGLFGIGGNGIASNGGYGGAGGGGWYGGSGTYPDGSGDDDRGGCGGSGYVLTESSNKPNGYLLDEKFYLTDTTLTTGGNNLSIGQSKIEIDVLNASFAKMLCKDSEGYKYFNDVDNQWEYLSSAVPTDEQFETHGSFKIVNDNGLLSDYEIYVLDSENANSSKIVLTVVPPKLEIRTKYYTKYLMSKFNVDADVDNTNVAFTVEAKRKGVAEDTHINFTINCNMTDVPSVQTKVYCIQGYTQGVSCGHREIKPKEKTIDHIDLLPVGTGNRMPSRYKSYIGSFINGDEAITTINSAVCCIRDRSVYSATLCNDKILRIAKLNLVSNTSTVIKDIPKADIGNTYYGDIAVDDKYIYITSSSNDNMRTIWRTSLDPDDMTVNSYSPGNSAIYNFNAVGKMEWWNDHTLIILARRGIFLFDTNKLKWDWKESPSQNNARRDMIVGKKYVISTYAGNSSSAFVCDVEKNEWFSLTDDFGISWAGQYLNAGCYADGKFYVTQRNRIHIVDEETMTIERSLPTPYTDSDPKTVDYANGLLYITLENSLTLYIYDIKNDRFYSTPIPFRMDAWMSNGWIRGTSYRGYFFLPNVRLFTINFAEYAKYNMGYKYDQFIMITNKDSLNNHEYEYDDRFITFTEDSMNIHTGDIVVDMESFDDERRIRCCHISKTQYNKILNQTILSEENNNEEEGENGEETNESS